MGGFSQEGIFVSACESYVNVYDVCVGVMVSGCFKVCVVDTHTCVGASRCVWWIHIHMWVLQGVCQCVKVFQGELRTRVHNDITFIATRGHELLI